MQTSVRDGGRRLVVREYLGYDLSKGRSVMPHVCSISLRPTVPPDVPRRLVQKLAGRPAVLAEVRARLAGLRGAVPAVNKASAWTPLQSLIGSTVSLLVVWAAQFARSVSDPAQRADAATRLLPALDESKSTPINTVKESM